jgi:glycosyltransferase involved in cell wall biosynthesis
MDEIRVLRDTVPGLPRRGFPELVSVGRLTAGKDPVTLVQAFHLFLRDFPGAHLTIIGDGPELAAVRAAAGAELDGSIHLEGAIYRESDVARHMKRADAFVMTGRVGLAINHALGYGLPTICFRRGENGPFHGSEIAHLQEGVTGYLVDEVSAAAFARDTAALFRAKPELKLMHRAPIDEYVRANLSVSRMVGGFRSIDRHLRGELQDAA